MKWLDAEHEVQVTFSILNLRQAERYNKNEL